MRRLLGLFWLAALFGCHATARAQAVEGPPALNIVGASAAEGIKLNRNGAGFSYLLTVEATKDAVPAVRIAVAPFLGPDGALVETGCEVNGKPCADGPVAVPALDSVQVKVTATLPLEGSYTSYISLIYGDKRWPPTTLSVTRTRATIPVEVLGVETVRDTPILWSGAKTVLVTLGGNPGAESYSLQLPTPVALALEGPNNTKLQAPVGRVTVKDDKGQEVSGEIKLKSGETRRYHMTIEGLSDAGQYTGTLRVAALDALPIGKPLTVVVKSSALCATLLIGVGVLVGSLLRRYGTRDRPRLLQQRRLLVLASEVSTLEREAGQLNDDEKGVLALIRRWIDDIYEDVQVGVAKDPDAAVELLDKKLTLIPLWVNARRRVEAVRPAELAEPFRAKLDSVRNFLREKQPAQDALKQAREALDVLPAEITKAVKDDLSKRLKDFGEEVERFRQSAKAPNILDALRLKVEPAIARAAGDVSAERFDAARASFDEARGEYARLLAEDLRASLDAAPVPSGFDAAQWLALKSEVAARLDQVSSTSDPDAALAAYRAAYAGYLQKLAGALRGEVEERRAKLNSEADKFTAEDLKSYADDLDGIFRLLDGVARRLAAGELKEAASEYQLAKDALAGIDARLKAGGMSMSSASSSSPADALPAGAVPGPGGELPTVAVLGREPRARPTVEALTRRLLQYDFAVTFAIFLVAVALGLYLLWINDPTWGGWGDGLTAVLWGLGLHRVADAPVELSGLRDRLTAPPAAP
ncbi:MAG: hypothetical protein ABW250_15490 [Pyrinomonadaceae bacterium]